MTVTYKGPLAWSGSRDGEEGQRTWTLEMLLYTDSKNDGPASVLSAADALYPIGSVWAVGNDTDTWAFCTPSASVREYGKKEGEPHFWWNVTKEFSTRPRKRCQNNTIENPLAEPDRVSGGFAKVLKEIQKDRNGVPILSSSLEQIRGIMRNRSHPTVIIEQTVPALGLDVFTSYIDKVNDRTMWGLGSRRIRLNDITWERLLYGTCNFYYTRRFEFEVKFDKFDESDIADKGFRRLKGEWVSGVWTPDAPAPAGNDPDDFVRITDRNGEPVPEALPLKNGDINPDPVGDPQFLGPFEIESEANFFDLGVPTSL